jgi:hypothetical protein
MLGQRQRGFMGIDIFSIFGGQPSAGGSLIPIRDPGSVTGSAFCMANMNLGGSVREKHILDEFMHGNIPDFLRHFAPVRVTKGPNSITYLAMTDYLSVGSNEDYVRMPMNPLTAQIIANKYDCTLPTRQMVNDIWFQSPNKLTPKPWGPPYDADMERTHRILTHSNNIQSQLQGLNPFLLTSGHKKDVVLTNYIAPNNPRRRVAIYGWMQKNGQPIQGLNYFSHEDTYADYSHGIRLVANDVIVNGNPMRIQAVFKDPVLCGLVSDEGPLRFHKY